ncbi:hypothetical protein EVA_12852 [gut metagenome]|uniref:Uncharacterized protein n=1 Tax=gut metagenome TaxID=749906 RepID=J9GHV7_9ZZZZ
MFWFVENLVSRTVFNDSTSIHNRNVITHRGNDTKVMRNHDDGHS